MKLYVVLAILPEEPYFIYFSAYGKDNQPLFHEAAGFIKKLSLKEANKIFNAIDVKDKEVTFCLMEWGKFISVYQNIGISKENFIANSLKTK